MDLEDSKQKDSDSMQNEDSLLFPRNAIATSILQSPADNPSAQPSAPGGIFSDCPRLIVEMYRQWRYSPPVVKAKDDTKRYFQYHWERLLPRITDLIKAVADFFEAAMAALLNEPRWAIFMLIFVLVSCATLFPRFEVMEVKRAPVPPYVPTFEESPYLWPTSVGDILFTYPYTDLDEESLMLIIEQKEGLKKGLHIFLHEDLGNTHITSSMVREKFDIINDRLRRHPRAPQNNLLKEHVDKDGRTLVIYNYVQNNLARRNLEFFFRHHNPEWADVLLVVNGLKLNCTIPQYVKVWKRPNIGLEACAHFTLWPYLLYGENPMDVDFPKEIKGKEYVFFMLLNASVRGPFFPSFWNGDIESLRSWVEVFKGPLIKNKDIGLVGTSFNCMRGIPYLTHLQSFALMTHRAGLEMMYKDLVVRERVLQMVDRTICEPRIDHMQKIITIQTFEIGASQTFLSRNIGITSILTAWQEVNIRDNWVVFELCMDQNDQMLPNRYYGKNVHLLEMIFHKTNSADVRTDMELVDMFTVWYDQRVKHYSWTSPEILNSTLRHTRKAVYRDVGYPVNKEDADLTILDYMLLRNFQ